MGLAFLPRGTFLQSPGAAALPPSCSRSSWYPGPGTDPFLLRGKKGHTRFVPPLLEGASWHGACPRDNHSSSVPASLGAAPGHGRAWAGPPRLESPNSRETAPLAPREERSGVRRSWPRKRKPHREQPVRGRHVKCPRSFPRTAPNHQALLRAAGTRSARAHRQRADKRCRPGGGEGCPASHGPGKLLQASHRFTAPGSITAPSPPPPRRLLCVLQRLQTTGSEAAALAGEEALNAGGDVQAPSV